jgi:hypothetical protein
MNIEMKKLSYTTFFIAALTLSAISCKKDKAETPAATVPTPTPTPSTTTVSYATSIAPIMTASCNQPGCHASGSSYGDFTSYAGLKTKATSGSLNNRVVVLKDMPQGTTLATADITKIDTWIKEGAKNN